MGTFSRYENSFTLRAYTIGFIYISVFVFVAHLQTTIRIQVYLTPDLLDPHLTKNLAVLDEKYNFFTYFCYIR